MIEAIIGTLSGTVIGFILSELSTKIKDDRAENKQVKSTRRMISLEIDRNLKLLHEVWSEINHPDVMQKDIEDQKKIKSARFVDLPTWMVRREVLDSQLSVFPIAFQDPETIQVFQFYDRVQRLDGIRKDLWSVMQESKQEYRDETSPAPGGRRSAHFYFEPYTAFKQRAIKLWDECEDIFVQIFNDGNPVK